jgi:F0F1-type ATP synthase membrane subunit c/vacuolar-type H+-ATPase subunit K
MSEPQSYYAQTPTKAPNTGLYFFAGVMLCAAAFITGIVFGVSLDASAAKTAHHEAQHHGQR